MAGLRKLRNKWYARIRLYDVSKSVNSERLIPLKTESKTTARIRLSEVSRAEKDIKNGIAFSFAWLNGEGKTRVIQLSLAEAVSKYKSARLIDGINPITLERFDYSIKTLLQVINSTIPVQRINQDILEKYKVFYSSIHRPDTINTNLSKIRAFLNWCERKRLIPKAPFVESVRTKEKQVSYLADSQFKSIMDLENIDNHFKRAFLFYRETGCRLREAFIGRVEGNWLIIEPDKAKTNKRREIELSPVLFQIVTEIQNRFEILQDKPYNLKSKSIIERYSKEFKKACRQVNCGDKKFHNLRDTFAVRLWALTGDIHYVSKVIGHSSVTMTEKYAGFNLRRLITDFPTIENHIKNRLNIPKISVVDTFSVDTKLLQKVPLDEVYTV